jgi:hypothetical protein
LVLNRNTLSVAESQIELSKIRRGLRAIDGFAAAAVEAIGRMDRSAEALGQLEPRAQDALGGALELTGHLAGLARAALVAVDLRLQRTNEHLRSIQRVELLIGTRLSVAMTEEKFAPLEDSLRRALAALARPEPAEGAPDPGSNTLR